MKKTDRWRQIRQQQRREKDRLRKLNKPIRRVAVHRREESPMIQAGRYAMGMLGALIAHRSKKRERKPSRHELKKGGDTHEANAGH
jgi:hypothetical protein